MTVVKESERANLIMYRNAGYVFRALRVEDGSWQRFPAIESTLAAALELLYRAWEQAENLLPPPADNVP